VGSSRGASLGIRMWKLSDHAAGLDKEVEVKTHNW